MASRPWLRSAVLLIVLATSGIYDTGNLLLSRGQASVNVTAECLSQFSWMNNGMNQSPCVVAAWEQEACGSNTWNIPALGSKLKYDPPNATTKNPCTCSWATYNLISACTVCQNSDNFVSWGTWLDNCDASYVSNTTYFPYDKDDRLPNETAIPFWAATNPITWDSAKFNATQAQAIQNQGHADLNGAPVPTATSSPKKSDTGAIVGGVVGGLAVIALTVFVITCGVLRRRKRFQPQKPYTNGPSRPNMGHTHALSDSSQRFLEPNGHRFPPGLEMSSVAQPHMTNGMLPLSYSIQSLSSSGQQPPAPPGPQMPGAMMPNTTRPAISPGAGIVTHSRTSPTQGHIPSASFQSLGGVMSPTEFNAQRGNHPRPTGQTGLEDVISPFISSQTSVQPTSHKAGSPNTSHDFSEGLPLTPSSPPSSSANAQRFRMNPPAYSAAPGLGAAQPVVPTRGDQKYEYDANYNHSRSNANMEHANLDGTAIETGRATYGSSLFQPTSMDTDTRWGGSTVAAGDSEFEGTVVAEDDRDARKQRRQRVSAS